VVDADSAERVQQRETALDLVQFDHALEDVLDRDTLALVHQVAGDSEDRLAWHTVVAEARDWSSEFDGTRGEHHAGRMGDCLSGDRHRRQSAHISFVGVSN
jgi:hypothetical protein